MQIELAENASAFDRPFEAQQIYSCNSSVIAIARIYVNVIHQLCISQYILNWAGFYSIIVNGAV